MKAPIYGTYIFGGPAFIYRCRKCGTRCNKPSVKESGGTLGHWLCPRCGRAKVVRSRAGGQQ